MTQLKRSKAILFDMGDTIIKYHKFDPIAGNGAVLEHAVSKVKVSPQEVSDFAHALSKELNIHRERSNMDYANQAFQRLLYSLLNIEINLTPYEMEVLFVRAGYQKMPMPGVIDLLHFLKAQGIRIGILSNTSFTEKALRQELLDMAIPDCFEFVLSTAEYVIRKPDPRIFKVCLNKLNLPPEDVWYVGNTVEYDVKGANEAGLQAIWINLDGQDPPTEEACITIENYKALETIILNCI